MVTRRRWSLEVQKSSHFDVAWREQQRIAKLIKQRLMYHCRWWDTWPGRVYTTLTYMCHATTLDRLLMLFKSRRARLSEVPSPQIPRCPVKPTQNIRFNKHPTSIPSPLFFFHLFNSNSIELLTGSGEVLLYHIQRCRHHSESGRYIFKSR